MANNDKNKSAHVPGTQQPGMGRSADDYARQQEDIRATQIHGESSLHRDSERSDQGLDRTSEERERGQGVEKGTGKPV